MEDVCPVSVDACIPADKLDNKCDSDELLFEHQPESHSSVGDCVDMNSHETEAGTADGNTVSRVMLLQAELQWIRKAIQDRKELLQRQKKQADTQ